MIPVHDKKRYAWRFLLMSITVVLGGGAPRAQTGPLLPSVDLRRDVRLNSEVWPADFNGDGITDLVASRAATTSTPGAMHVVLGRGDGTFGTPIVTSVTGRVIEVGDFNGDRRVDVVVAADTNGVSILPGNGNGTFGAARQVDSEFGAFAITGDFNGDTRRDLILAGGPEIRVYPGNGDFTFGTPARLPFGELWPSSDCLASTVLDTPPCGGGVSGDFDNDGDRDFVVAGDSQAIHIFLNNGALLFQAREIVVGFQPTDVTTRDLDGNGALDLVVTVTSSENGGHSEGTVNVLKGNGDGTFQPAVRYRTGNGAFQVVVGDFTHDGQIDIATANRSAIFWPNCGPFIQSSDSVSILPGNNGVFGAPTTFALEDQSIPVDVDTSRFRNSVLSLNTSDLDRDRFPDLIVSQGALLLTRAPAANRPPIANAGPDVTIVNSSFVQLIGAATDPDNHLLDFVWRGPEGTDGLIIHPSSFCFEGLTLGAHTFTLSVDDGHGGHDDDAVVMTLEDRSVPPEVQVLRPAGGEVVAAGAPYTIRWTASDDRGIARIDLGAFIDVGPNGRSVPISECTGLAPTATECTWRNPPPTEGAIVFVSVRDTDGNIGGGASGQFFIRGTVPPNSLPEGWTNRDVGAVGAAGSSAFSAGRFTIRGSGADIWNNADEFQFAYRAIDENGEITARVDSVQNLDRWVKAGVMIRESADAGARHVSLFATPTTEKGVAFQRRKTTGGASVHTAGPAITAPLWLRLTRVGDVFRSYYRKNTVDAWTLVGEETVPGFATPALFGLAVTSHVDGRLAEAVFSSVRADNLPTWTTSLVGTTQGSATFDQTRFSVDGAGADIWGTADGFTALWTGLVVPEETLTARVLSLENTNVWAKAGVMIRETMDPGGRHVMVVVTPGKGVAMQWRADRDGPSLSTTARPGAAPAWVRLIRRGNAYTGQTSSDGVTWVTLGTVNLSMSPSTNTLVVTSHNAAAVATAIFDDVRVERP